MVRYTVVWNIPRRNLPYRMEESLLGFPQIARGRFESLRR